MLLNFDEIIGQRRRERIEVFEREPARELVASRDILRRDQASAGPWSRARKEPSRPHGSC